MQPNGLAPESIESWLAKMPKSLPLKAVSHPNEEPELLKRQSDSHFPKASLDLALLWLRIGEIESPHAGMGPLLRKDV